MSTFIKQELIINGEEDHVPMQPEPFTTVRPALVDPTFCALCIRDVPTNGNFYEYNHQNSTEFRALLGELFGIELHLQHFIVCRTCWKMLQMVGDFRECCFKGQSWMERFEGKLKSDDEWLSEEMVQMIDCLQAAIEDHMELIEQNDAIEENGDGGHSTGTKGQAGEETMDYSGLYGMNGEYEDQDASQLMAEVVMGESMSELNTSKQDILCKICNVVLKRDSLVKHKRSKRHRIQVKIHKRTQLNLPLDVDPMVPTPDSEESDWYEDIEPSAEAQLEVTQEKSPVIEKQKENMAVECKICNMSFSRWPSLVRHRLTKQHQMQAKEAGCEEETAGKTLYCAICDHTFTRPDYYKGHLKTKRHLMLLESQNETDEGVLKEIPQMEHFLDPEPQPQPIIQTMGDEVKLSNNDGEEGAIEFKCRFCQCLNENKYQLEKHMHKFHYENMHKCRVSCKKRFLSRKNLIVHERTCREKSLICSICKLKLGSQKALLAHEKHFHSGALWKCKYCEKRYKRSADLQQHQELSHAKEIGKKHRCNICGRVVKSARALEYHQFTHTGARPFKCNQCGKGFIYNWGLTRHIRSNH